MVNRTNYCPTVIVLPACLYCHFSGNSLFFSGRKNRDMPPLNLALDVTPSNFCAESYFFARFNWPPAKVWQKSDFSDIWCQFAPFLCILAPDTGTYIYTYRHRRIYLYLFMNCCTIITKGQRWRRTNIFLKMYFWFQSNLQTWLNWPSQENSLSFSNRVAIVVK